MSDDRTSKNQVFQENAPIETKSDDHNGDLPVEIVPLPSMGLVYPTTSTLHGKKKVEIKALTTREEDILTNKVLLKKGTVITELIRSCLLDRSVDPSELLAGDRNALMVAIRVTGYGQHYDADVTCGNPECGVSTSRTFDLQQLGINPLTIEPVVLGQNVFEFHLPKSGKKILFKFLTGNDEEASIATAEQQKKLGIQQSNNVTSQLIKMIISIDGVTDRNVIINFVNKMSAQDSHAFRSYVRKNEPGVNMKQTTECHLCGHVEEVAIPIGVSFLYPSLDS